MRTQFNPIKITVSNSDDRNVTLSIPWDSSLDDWKTAFKTILIFQTFSEDQVKELFELNEDY